MLFNSLAYSFFLPIVFAIYWWLANKKQAIRLQNLFLLAASYLFYAWWDWRLLLLIVASSLIDFMVGLQLQKTESGRKRKYLLAISLVSNLGLLGFFKYFNFFLQSLTDLLSSIGLEASLPTLSILLPVGISFYTFQTLSYTIDIYRKTLKATTNLLPFLTFVAFFPQLVAGPIERAKDLLPQFERPRHFDYANAVVGLRRILWGIFKKVVIADGLAVFVSYVFADEFQPNGIESLFGMVFFTIQIYCDFSGYSDIALGSASLLGLRLNINFASPLFGSSLREFWAKWHISLTSWFRDYVYVPLGGNRKGNLATMRNLMLVFLLSGLWHGANYTFLIWAVIHGVFLLVERSFRLPAKLPKIVGHFSTLLVVIFAFVFFRAKDLPQAFGIFHGLWDWSQAQTAFANLESDWLQLLSTKALLGWAIGLSAFMFLIEWGIDFSGASHRFDQLPRSFRWLTYYVLIAILLAFGAYGTPQQFIYFQF